MIKTTIDPAGCVTYMIRAPRGVLIRMLVKSEAYPNVVNAIWKRSAH